VRQCPGKEFLIVEPIVKRPFQPALGFVQWYRSVVAGAHPAR
jgi:hypothetical protein